MHPLRLLLGMLFLCLGGNALGEAPIDSPIETVTGEELFVACTFCHGSSAQGNDRRDGPALAGLEAWYLELQMHNFKNGVRGNLAADVPGQVMHFSSPMLRNDFTIESLADYISALEPGNEPDRNAVGARPFIWNSPYAGLDSSIVANAQAGKTNYSRVCTACHGADALGNEALGAANLTYLSEIYMARQLMYFRDGIRGAHPEDTRGQQMAVMAELLTDDQMIADVVAYIAEL